MEFEVFYDRIKAINNVLRITIPDKLVQFAGFKEGDVVKVMIRKADFNGDDKIVVDEKKE